MENKKFKVVALLSKIDWKGRKMTGRHNGTVAIKEGEFGLNEGKLVAGKFIVDTTTIKILDITDPAANAQFVGHMMSNDFFASSEYPEASFEITGVKNNHVEGNLMIRGISRVAGFDAVIRIEGDTLTATGKLIIDRTQFGIKFRSGNFFKDLGDTLIHNDFELNLEITAKSQD